MDCSMLQLIQHHFFIFSVLLFPLGMVITCPDQSFIQKISIILVLRRFLPFERHWLFKFWYLMDDILMVNLISFQGNLVLLLIINVIEWLIKLPDWYAEDQSSFKNYWESFVSGLFLRSSNFWERQYSNSISVLG